MTRDRLRRVKITRSIAPARRPQIFYYQIDRRIGHDPTANDEAAPNRAVELEVLT